ncbi:hypothetical protein NPIL_124641 [Nephila pilipes]|uniref:Uncharacterized protein n=1 Tax=Nephila pilipes TaxID=299642 RepID=A0A8X6K2W0_NEPPI|nr:hypothetical protein NPIL_124641 [Nephila pilipes]
MPRAGAAAAMRWLRTAGGTKRGKWLLASKRYSTATLASAATVMCDAMACRFASILLPLCFAVTAYVANLLLCVAAGAAAQASSASCVLRRGQRALASAPCRAVRFGSSVDINKFYTNIFSVLK